MKTNNHGGVRSNAGRPKLGKKKYLITCYENQIDIIRDFIKKLPVNENN